MGATTSVPPTPNAIIQTIQKPLEKNPKSPATPAVNNKSNENKKSKKNKLKGTAEQYMVNPALIQRNEDTRQFLMIKNIPNSFTQDKLLAILENYVQYEIEFFYLPLDKNTGCNLGYGYVSLVDHKSVLKLYNAVRFLYTASYK